jgi:hypothetical protein
MPLPVIFKFISDTSGSKFDKVIGEMDEVKFRSEKASRSIKSLASVLRESQDPASALAEAMSGLARAFSFGVGATVAIVAAVEIIKSFIKNADDMNKATESLNNALENFRQQADNLDMSSAISQIRLLTKELEKASQIGKTRPEDRFFGTVVDAFLGGAQMKSDIAQQATRQAIKSATAIAEQSIQEKGRLQILKLTNKVEFDRLAVAKKYSVEIKKAQEIGLSQLSIRELEFQRAVDLEQIDIEAAKQMQLQIAKENEERTKLAEKETARQEEQQRIDQKLHDERMKQIQRESDARDKYIRAGFEGSGSLLDKISEAAKRRGRPDIVRNIEAERASQLKQTDVALLGRLGEPTGERGLMGLERRQIERQRITSFAGMEGENQRQQNATLFQQVDSVRMLMVNILQVINNKLGVPILRSAN